MNKDSLFESIKHYNEIGQEYWSARELYSVLDYLKWDKFLNVLKKAETSCENSGQNPEDHFPRVEKLVKIGSGATRNIGDIQLSRYACYLIVQNADPSKEVIALGQTYFTVQTRKQEIIENEFEKLRYGIYARLGYKWAALYFNMRLNDVFDELANDPPNDMAGYKNPTIPPLQVGITIFL